MSYNYASLALALQGIDAAIENIAHFMEYSTQTTEGAEAIQELRGVRLYVKRELKKAIHERMELEALWAENEKGEEK